MGHLQRREPQFVEDCRHLCDIDYGDWDRTEDLPERPHSKEARRTGKTSAAGPHGGTAEPDQPAFSFQYLEFGVIAGAFRPGHRPRIDYQTRDYSKKAAAQHGRVRPVAG